MVAASNRGKTAESLVRARLETLCQKAAATFLRLPDAHAGSRAATLADFLYVREGTLYLIEVKETQHDYRLPHGNFEAGQVARMRRVKMAGGKALVVIYHSTLKLWRGYDIDRFAAREGGSWDLRDTEPKSLLDLL
jgi:penicillin-binding protein-related factor A (putative recombinase)